MSRVDPDRVAAARARARVVAARALRARPGLAAGGRLAGRLGAGLAPLPEGLDGTAPETALIADPARAKLVFEAAAAALIAGDLARAITPEVLAALPVPALARAFGLRHRALALPGARADDFARLTGEIRALWADALPAPLCGEYRPTQSLPPIPDAAPAPLPVVSRPKNKAILLPLAPRASGAPHRLALDAALAAFPAAAEDAAP
ncbi:hypothetical protein [Paracoccus aminophilus]|uniref:Type III secretion system protein n=1 Tax=Paracoccus aminophilus JCM 7686 TaxID=1367847 RepID=S5YUG1_PARAH|nr:hypothetical protein [Paracoccus aminophilus]AGT08881.1 type III secretion system protein [Paracoccus aminophilus JCM 7686]